MENILQSLLEILSEGQLGALFAALVLAGVLTAIFVLPKYFSFSRTAVARRVGFTFLALGGLGLLFTAIIILDQQGASGAREGGFGVGALIYFVGFPALFVFLPGGLALLGFVYRVQVSRFSKAILTANGAHFRIWAKALCFLALAGLLTENVAEWVSMRGDWSDMWPLTVAGVVAVIAVYPVLRGARIGAALFSLAMLFYLVWGVRSAAPDYIFVMIERLQEDQSYREGIGKTIFVTTSYFHAISCYFGAVAATCLWIPGK